MYIPIRTVYMITCIKNGLFYIGSTYDLKQRLQHHFRNLSNGQHTNKAMQFDFNKFGRDDFIVTTLFTIRGWCNGNIENAFIYKLR